MKSLIKNYKNYPYQKLIFVSILCFSTNVFSSHDSCFKKDKCDTIEEAWEYCQVLINDSGRKCDNFICHFDTLIKPNHIIVSPKDLHQYHDLAGKIFFDSYCKTGEFEIETGKCLLTTKDYGKPKCENLFGNPCNASNGKKKPRSKNVVLIHPGRVKS